MAVGRKISEGAGTHPKPPLYTASETKILQQKSKQASRIILSTSTTRIDLYTVRIVRACRPGSPTETAEATSG